MSSRSWLCASLVMALSPQRAAATETKLAVMPLAAKRVPAATVDILDDLLVNEVGAKSGSTVIASQDINAILGLDRMKDALGCSDLSCAVQIGGALGVDFLLTGSVSTLGGEVIVSLTLIDTQQSVAKKRAQVRIIDEERLYAFAIAAAVAQLYDLPAPAPPVAAGDGLAAPGPAAPSPTSAGLWIRTEFEGVTVTVRSATGGEPHTCAEAVSAAKPCYLDGLPPGPATVEFVHGDATVTRDLVLNAGELGRRLQLSPSGWLVQIIIGAAFEVLGGIGMAVALSMDETTLDPITNEPRWGKNKTAIFSGGAAFMALGTAAVIVGLASDPYTVEELFGPPGVHTANAGGHPIAVGLMPLPGGAAAMAAWSF